MDDKSLGIVLERLDECPLNRDVEELVLAACQGAEAIADLLGGQPAAPPRLPDEPDSTPPAVAYLTGVRVRGFRGIGETAELAIPPGPGLTLVVGRNGTGKSSLAEAVEMALTGANYRWEGRSRAWRDGWRNLHVEGPSRIEVELAVQGRPGTTVVSRRWPPGVGLEDADVRVQPQGEPVTDLGSLGWVEALRTFRPFLPYSELGSMLEDGPSALYDAVSSVLGLDALDHAREQLRQARLARQRRERELLAEAEELADELAEVDDERAAAVAGALTADGGPDVETLADLVEGTGPAPRFLALLRRLAELPRLDLDQVDREAEELREAARTVEGFAGTDADRARQTAELLDGALTYHRDHGEVDCPVCGEGRLDEQWRRAVQARITELEELAAEVEAARSRLGAAVTALSNRVSQTPEVLEETEPAGIRLSELREVQRSWREAVNAAGEPEAKAEAFVDGACEVAAAGEEIRGAAEAALQAREDRWRPHASRIAGWLPEARRSLREARRVGDLEQAEGWFKDALDEVRERRWAPIEDRAKQVWERLRDRSNVSLEQIKLAGSTTRRRVELGVAVDGRDGVALGVMSQGELHSLALSLFLPRATTDDSPFRFLVIDDPVQSMDPAKVDGLARVLEETATTHQVIVFTHDDRLRQAISYLQIDARVLEVTRREDSHVSVRPAWTPTERHLEDARAIDQDDRMPLEVRRRVAPGFCRMALEATCVALIRRERLGRGRPHREVEQDLVEAETLVKKLALVLFDDLGRAGDVYGRLVRQFGTWAERAARDSNTGSHGAFDGNVTALVEDTDRLVGALESL